LAERVRAEGHYLIGRNAQPGLTFFELSRCSCRSANDIYYCLQSPKSNYSNQSNAGTTNLLPRQTVIGPDVRDAEVGNRYTSIRKLRSLYFKI